MDCANAVIAAGGLQAFIACLEDFEATVSNNISTETMIFAGRTRTDLNSLLFSLSDKRGGSLGHRLYSQTDQILGADLRGCWRRAAPDAVSTRTGSFAQADRHQRHLGCREAQRRAGPERGGHRSCTLPGEEPQQH